MNIEGNFQVTLWRHPWCHHNEICFFWHNFGRFSHSWYQTEVVFNILIFPKWLPFWGRKKLFGGEGGVGGVVWWGGGGVGVGGVKHFENLTKLNTYSPWWCHTIETYSAVLALCRRNQLPPQVDSPNKGPVIWRFGVFFYVGLNKLLSR